MKTFSNIRFKKKTALRFQHFSKRFFKTHTETLETMLNFFLFNEISPKETLGPSMRTLETTLQGRINSLIAIIKDIEKSQTKPTAAMLQLLFEHTPATKEKQHSLTAVQSTKIDFKNNSFDTSFEAIELRKEKNELKQELLESKKEFLIFLNTIQIVKGSFGKRKLQLDMSPETLEILKQKLNNNRHVY